MRLDNFNLQKKYLFNWSKLDEHWTRLRFEFVRFCCFSVNIKTCKFIYRCFSAKKKNTHYRFPINALNAKKYMIFSNQSEPMRENAFENIRCRRESIPIFVIHWQVRILLYADTLKSREWIKFILQTS